MICFSSWKLNFFHVNWNIFRSKCNMEGCFGVERDGIRGGLVFLWKAEIQLIVKSFSTGHMTRL